jgi:hypothetical protein
MRLLIVGVLWTLLGLWLTGIISLNTAGKVLAIALTVSAMVMGAIVVVVITGMAFLAHFVPKD